MDKSFLFALLASFIWGFAPVLEKTGLGGRIDPYTGVVIRTIPIAILGVVGLLLMGRLGNIATVDPRSALFVAAGGLVAGLMGQLAFYWALKTGEASVVVPVAATYPLFALFVSMLFLGEAFTWQKLAGIALIVSGVMLIR